MIIESIVLMLILIMLCISYYLLKFIEDVVFGYCFYMTSPNVLLKIKRLDQGVALKDCILEVMEIPPLLNHA